MKNASSQIVYDYWDRLRGKRAAPERAEINPGEIRAALADAFVLEVDDESAIFRLAGTRMATLFGRELKGVALEELWHDPSGWADFERLLYTVKQETAGAVIGLIVETNDGDRLYFEMLLLPLKHRGKGSARVIGTLSAMSFPAWLGQKAVSQLRMISVQMLWPRSPFGGFASAEARRASFVVHQGGR